MKKFVVAAALVSAMVLPVSAADMAAPTDKEVNGVKVICYLLPLLPDCIEAWKAKGEEAKAKWEEATSK